MKAYIQHNFTSGIGDFYSDVVAYSNIATTLRENGYEVNLLICTHNKNFLDGPDIFQKIFDKKTQSIFNSIKEINMPITDKKINDTVYYEGPYKSCPGIHHWDIYFDIPYDDISIYTMSTKQIYEKNYNKEVVFPSFAPFLEEQAYNFASNLSSNDYVFLHLRLSRNDDILSKDSILLEKIISFAEKSDLPVHLGTHSEYLFYKLKTIKNINVFNFKNTIKTDKEIAIHFERKKNISVNQQAERLLETFAEMISIKYAKKIVYYNEYGMLSNFLLYALLHNDKLIVTPLS